MRRASELNPIHRLCSRRKHKTNKKRAFIRLLFYFYNFVVVTTPTSLTPQFIMPSRSVYTMLMLSSSELLNLYTLVSRQSKKPKIVDVGLLDIMKQSSHLLLLVPSKGMYNRLCLVLTQFLCYLLAVVLLLHHESLAAP